MRPVTLIELSELHGYGDLPSHDPVELARWFSESAYSGSLERYLETFTHTVGVMQTRDALIRVASECVQDLAADGVVYAEVRFAPELHVMAGLDLDEVVQAVLDGFAAGHCRGQRGRLRDQGPRAAHRDEARGPVAGDRRPGRQIPRS